MPAMCASAGSASPNTSHSVSNVQPPPRWSIRRRTCRRDGVADPAGGREAKAKRAAGSMKRLISQAEAMRSTPGRGRVTQRRFWKSAVFSAAAGWRGRARAEVMWSSIRRTSAPASARPALSKKSSRSAASSRSRSDCSARRSWRAGLRQAAAARGRRRGALAAEAPQQCTGVARDRRECGVDARLNSPTSASSTHRPRTRSPARRPTRSPLSATRSPRASPGYRAARRPPA